jgi:hypothetical protein
VVVAAAGAVSSLLLPDEQPVSVMAAASATAPVRMRMFPPVLWSWATP